jgi:hypothetical protein
MKSNILFLVFLFSVGLAFSQGGEWYNRASLEGKIDATKKLSFSASVQSRWNLSNPSFNKTMYTLESAFDITKSIRLGVLYRNSWIRNPHILLDGKKMTTPQRFAASLRFNPSKILKIDKYLTLLYATKIQFEGFKFKRDQFYWRNKITLKGELKGNVLKPYVSAESFYRKNQYFYLLGDEFITEGLMNEMRYAIGTEINFNKSNMLDLQLLVRDYQTTKLTDFVACISFSHKFSKKKK